MEIVHTSEVPWAFTAVYASPNPTKRKDLWSSLTDYASSHNLPWIIGGDFNDTRYDWECINCREVKRRAKQFNTWIEDMELLELEFVGPSHTWARGLTKETRKSSRLNRALCNSSWATRFSNAYVKILPTIQ
ncbi:Zeaxanthin epoxidase chloroplastic [Bienertia sinuspersici]